MAASGNEVPLTEFLEEFVDHRVQILGRILHASSQLENDLRDGPVAVREIPDGRPDLVQLVIGTGFEIEEHDLATGELLMDDLLVSGRSGRGHVVTGRLVDGGGTRTGGRVHGGRRRSQPRRVARKG